LPGAQRTLYLQASEPSFFAEGSIPVGHMLVNLGPQHPSTHGVMRLEVLTDGEYVRKIVPHIGYLHRCFEKHAEALPFNQIIPFVDRLDYLSAINCEHIFCSGIEDMMGITGTLHPRTEYIRVLCAEMNRLASHFVALGTYGLDIGAFSPFLWLMREREHIQRLLEWVSGARMLYNYIWVGGLYYDLPIGFEEQVLKFAGNLEKTLDEVKNILLLNSIFIARTANVGVLPLDTAISYGATGSVLRASGLALDLRKTTPFSIYPQLDFSVPIGEGAMGTTGDTWDRNWVRLMECYQSLSMVQQCAQALLGEHKRTPTYNPQEHCPKKIRPEQMEYYFQGESPRGQLGFFFQTDGKRDIPLRCKVRSPAFSNLSLLPAIAEGALLADVIAILGSLDLVMGEVDR